MALKVILLSFALTGALPVHVVSPAQNPEPLGAQAQYEQGLTLLEKKDIRGLPPASEFAEELKSETVSGRGVICTHFGDLRAVLA